MVGQSPSGDYLATRQMWQESVL